MPQSISRKQDDDIIDVFHLTHNWKVDESIFKKYLYLFKKSLKSHLTPRPGVGSWCLTTKCQHSFWRPTHADNTSRDSRSQVTRLESLRDGFLEHAVLVDGGHPVGVGGCVVVATPVPVALDERPRSEVLQTRSWRRKGLSGPICTSVSVLRKVRSNSRQMYLY